MRSILASCVAHATHVAAGASRVHAPADGSAAAAAAAARDNASAHISAVCATVGAPGSWSERAAAAQSIDGAEGALCATLSASRSMACVSICAKHRAARQTDRIEPVMCGGAPPP